MTDFSPLKNHPSSSQQQIPLTNTVDQQHHSQSNIPTANKVVEYAGCLEGRLFPESSRPELLGDPELFVTGSKAMEPDHTSVRN